MSQTKFMTKQFLQRRPCESSILLQNHHTSKYINWISLHMQNGHRCRTRILPCLALRKPKISQLVPTFRWEYGRPQQKNSKHSKVTQSHKFVSRLLHLEIQHQKMCKLQEHRIFDLREIQQFQLGLVESFIFGKVNSHKR